MNSIILTFLIIGVAGSVFIIVFSEKIKTAILEILVKAVSENTTETAPKKEPAPLPPPATTKPQWVPPGFKGPTGEPRIIGPRENPPNY